MMGWLAHSKTVRLVHRGISSCVALLVAPTGLAGRIDRLGVR